MENAYKLKKILIISPHFPPSNLTAVHRARFLANHLTDYGWEPIILTVHEKYYEEEPDPYLEKILPEGLRVEKVNAFRVTRPRLIGDIGLRAFVQMYRRAKQIIKNEKIDFLYITIPSFYGALWGRWLHESTGIPYGIDYIDPWVHEFPGSNKLFSRHWFATKVSGFLEPIAVLKASMITGVAASYYEDVIKRNPHLPKHASFTAIPFGSEANDHEAVERLQLQPYLFNKKPGTIQMVYAGAMLPKAYGILDKLFETIAANKELFHDVEFHFIGTGKKATDPESYTIRPYAEKYGLWQTHVFEYAKRIPYLDVLVHLNAATGVFILGSTEPHYTPSKVYQAVLSGKPIFGILHRESTAVGVIEESLAGLVLKINGEGDVPALGQQVISHWARFRAFIQDFDPRKVDQRYFNTYSAREITGKFVEVLNKQMNG